MKDRPFATRTEFKLIQTFSMARSIKNEPSRLIDTKNMSTAIAKPLNADSTLFEFETVDKPL